MDTSTKRELIASSHSSEEIRKYITADSVAYPSLEGVLKTPPGSPNQYCSACFTKKYPLLYAGRRAAATSLRPILLTTPIDHSLSERAWFTPLLRFALSIPYLF
jgi:hypothetical protein